MMFGWLRRRREAKAQADRIQSQRKEATYGVSRSTGTVTRASRRSDDYEVTSHGAVSQSYYSSPSYDSGSSYSSYDSGSSSSSCDSGGGGGGGCADVVV